jgi:DNA modification methylase
MPVPISDKPYWTSPDGEKARMYLGDVRRMLGVLPAKSVHCIVTSPPYWGLRDYGTAVWQGGKSDCDHDAGKLEKRTTDTYNNSGNYTRAYIDKIERGMAHIGRVCQKCGARRIDQQIGSEPSPDCGNHGQAQCGGCFVCTMVEVFRGVYRVLRDDGCLWLNLGDTYGDGGQLQGIPWRVALALQHDGWILRSDIPWVKRASMPESVTNRPAKALEYVFLLTKSMGYYIDMIAIKPKSTNKESIDGRRRRNPDKFVKAGGTKAVYRTGFSQIAEGRTYPTRNFRNADLWFQSIEAPHGLIGLETELVGLDVTSESYPGAHFATYPKKLVEPCILAGTSDKGACGKCGAPWERIVEDLPPENGRPISRNHTESNPYAHQKSLNAGGSGAVWPKKTIGWQPTCECFGKLVKQRVIDSEQTDEENASDAVETTVYGYEPSIPLEQHPIVPCKVLDPFMGSGTTAVVSIQHGRIAWGIELSKQYIDLHIIPRLNRIATNPLAESKAFKEINNRLGSKFSQKDRIPKRK